MKRLTVLAATVLAASAFAPPASAASVAYCDPGFVSGAIAYSPPLVAQAPSVQPVSWVLTLHMVCTGTSPSAGTYDMTVKGQGVESCTTGTSHGVVVSGTKSGGAFSGPIVAGDTTLTRIGVHYWGYPPQGGGSVTVATAEGETKFTMHIWLDNVMTRPGEGGGVTCPGAGTPIVGHGVIFE